MTKSLNTEVPPDFVRSFHADCDPNDRKALGTLRQNLEATATECRVAGMTFMEVTRDEKTKIAHFLGWKERPRDYGEEKHDSTLVVDGPVTNVFERKPDH